MSDDEGLIEAVHTGFHAQRLRLTPEQETAFARYLGLLERWNRTVNLTAIRDRDRAVLRHFVEPALALPLLAGAGPRMLDVGSGAGMPGLPLKILEPDRECLVVEASAKKANFLREVVETLGLQATVVLEGRFEELARGETIPVPVHLLTARAWTGYGPMLGLAARLMAPGGRAVLLVGDETVRELHRNLVRAGGPPHAADRGWDRAARAGWEIRRVMELRHLDRAYAVSLELPSS